jgi:hypothetical protein
MTVAERVRLHRKRKAQGLTAGQQRTLERYRYSRLAVTQLKACIDCQARFERPAKCGACPCCTHISGTVRESSEGTAAACDAWRARCERCDQ